MTKELADRETIITFNPVDNTASIWTYDRTWQKHIETRLKIKPNKIHGQIDNGGARDYTVPKKSISMPKAPKQLSEETKEKLRENLARGRAKKLGVTEQPRKRSKPQKSVQSIAPKRKGKAKRV